MKWNEISTMDSIALTVITQQISTVTFLIDLIDWVDQITKRQSNKKEKKEIRLYVLSWGLTPL